MSDSGRDPASSVQIFESTAIHDSEPDRESHRTRLADTLRMIPPGHRSLLEVGCGPGYLLHRVPLSHTFGIDLSRRSVQQLRRPGAVASALELPFADNSVDVVLCAETLEHLDAGQRPRAARELVRVARHHVVISVPYRERLLESSGRCPRCGRVFHLHGHLDSLDESDLRALFPAARRLVFDYSWRVRPFSRGLLKLRTETFDLWKHTAHTVCPGCGNQEFANDQHRPLYRVFNGLNQILNPRRSVFNWLLLRAELE